VFFLLQMRTKHEVIEIYLLCYVLLKIVYDCALKLLCLLSSNKHLLAAAAAAGQFLTHLLPLASVAAVEVQNPPPARLGLEVERPPCRPKVEAAGRSQSLLASIQ